MFAAHVEPELPSRLDVVAQRLVRRGRVQPIRPEALVQQPVVEDERVVQQDPRESLCIGTNGDFSHPEVAGHRVHASLALFQRHLQVIEERIVRPPEPRTGNRDLDQLSGFAHSAGDFLAGVHHDGLDAQARIHGRYIHYIHRQC